MATVGCLCNDPCCGVKIHWDVVGVWKVLKMLRVFGCHDMGRFDVSRCRRIWEMGKWIAVGARLVILKANVVDNVALCNKV